MSTRYPPASVSGTMVCAYFDIDGTLISGSTLALYLGWLRELGLMRRGDGLRVLGYELLYRLGLLRIEQAYGWLGRRTSGLGTEELTREGERWCEETLVAQLFPAALRCIEEHRRQGHRVALLTASVSFISIPLARKLGIPKEDVLCTWFEQEQGRLSGRVREPICYGTGKVHHAREHARAQGCDLSRSFFYSDSVSDLPMLEEVGHPRVVNPDRLLRAQARWRGWEVLRF